MPRNPCPPPKQNILLAILLKIYFNSNTPPHPNKCLKKTWSQTPQKKTWCCVLLKYQRKWKEPTTTKTVVVLFTTGGIWNLALKLRLVRFQFFCGVWSKIQTPPLRRTMFPWKELNIWFFLKKKKLHTIIRLQWQYFSRHSFSLFLFWQFSVTCSAFYGSDIGNFVPFVTSQLILSNADVQGNPK